MSDSSNIFEIIDRVVENDYCIGCGACAVLDESPIEIKLNTKGQYQAYLKSRQFNDDLITTLDAVCPFTNASLNEDEISNSIFTDDLNFDKKIGYYDTLYAGFVEEGSYRVNGSSGGFGNWIASELLRHSVVDEVIHVKGGDDMMYKYSISKTVQELPNGAKSRYYPVEMSDILNHVKKTDKRYAIVGIPCFIKAVRLLSKQDKIINQNIVFTIGLVCGHLKSSFYSEMLAWDMGYKPNSNYEINFREKIPNKNASDYGTKIITEEGDNKIKQTKKIFGTTWGHGFFKYNACDFCDDVVAETADITIGDAWLPDYVEDYLGTNIIISRNKNISQIIEKAHKEGRVKVENLRKEKIIESQAGGFRHRHNGLAYRLYLKDKNKKWRPNKRIESSNQKLNLRRKLIYRARIILRKKSFIKFLKAKNKASLNYFRRRMSGYIFLHEMLTKITVKKVINKMKTFFH